MENSKNKLAAFDSGESMYISSLPLKSKDFMSLLILAIIFFVGWSSLGIIDTADVDLGFIVVSLLLTLCLRFDKLKLLVMAAAILFMVWDLFGPTRYLGVDYGIIFFLTSMSLLLLGINASYSNRSAIFWLFVVGLVSSYGVFFFKVCEYNSNPIVSAFICLLFFTYIFIYVKMAKSVKIASTNEGLIRFCLKSKSFCLLLVLTAVIIYFLISGAFTTKEDCNDEMCGLIIVYGSAASVLYFFPLIMGGMALTSRKVKKSILSVFLFSIVTIVALLLWVFISIEVGSKFYGF